jgi:hypothetical protein
MQQMHGFKMLLVLNFMCCYVPLSVKFPMSAIPLLKRVKSKRARSKRN